MELTPASTKLIALHESLFTPYRYTGDFHNFKHELVKAPLNAVSFTFQVFRRCPLGKALLREFVRLEGFDATFEGKYDACVFIKLEMDDETKKAFLAQKRREFAVDLVESLIESLPKGLYDMDGGYCYKLACPVDLELRKKMLAVLQKHCDENGYELNTEEYESNSHIHLAPKDQEAAIDAFAKRKAKELWKAMHASSEE